jgi:hypothetical protein
MTFSLNQYTFISEFVETAATKSYQFLAFLNKVLTSFVVLIMLFLSLFAIIGMASHTQKLEADVGLRHQNISTKEVKFYKKIKNAILNPVKANAFSLNPLDGLGEILGSAMKAVAGPIFNIITDLITNAIMPIFNSILQPILDIVNKILVTVNSLLTTLESLISNISATRVANGFRVYKDIQGANGQGTSNFESSGGFTKRLLGLTSTNTQNVFNSSFPKKDEVKNLLDDTIAWSDFMTVQKTMQYNLLGSGDITTAVLKSTLINFDSINKNVADIVIGKKCENSDIIFAQTPVFKSFGGVQNTCVAENRGIVIQQLVSRQDQIAQATLAKSQQYEVSLPADCKYGQYFDLAKNATIDYDENNPGDLGLRIAAFAGTISIKSITATECFTLITSKQNQTNEISKLLSPVNIASTVISGGSIFAILGKAFGDTKKELFNTIEVKFKQASETISSIVSGSAINNGVGIIGAMSTVLSIKDKINSKLDSLNQEYEQYRNGQYQALDNSETTLNEINKSA